MTRSAGLDGGLFDERSMTGRRVASYERYAEAQGAVDRLSDAGFPVEHTSIVGSDLRLVEDVTGRVTVGRAALAGAGAGAWFGLLIGLFFALFAESTGSFLALVVWGVVIGAAFGIAFGAMAHAATGGRRDFSSSRRLVAARYDLLVDETNAERATDLLRRA